VDWPRAERALGSALSADYKQLVETSGDGIFDETIWLLVPDSAFDECDLHAQTMERDEILGTLWEFEDKSVGLLETGVRVLPSVGGAHRNSASGVLRLLCDVPTPTKHRFATAGQTLGITRQ
jgi:hypothetical protein